MKNKNYIQHTILIIGMILTLGPFYFVISNAIRSNNEIFRSPFAFPQAITNVVSFTALKLTGQEQAIEYTVRSSEERRVGKECRARRAPGH